jgi:serine/threonine protein kinase
MSLRAGSRIGSYEIQSALGTGGMGEVYGARDTRLNRDVAIKILPEDDNATTTIVRRCYEDDRACLIHRSRPRGPEWSGTCSTRNRL